MEQNIEAFTINTAYTEEEVYAQIDLEIEESNKQLQEDLKKVSKSKKLICGRFVVILALVLVIFLLIFVAFAMVGYSLVNLIVQQGRLSSQGNNINTLYGKFNNSTQLITALLAQLGNLKYDTSSLHGQLYNSTQLITTLQAQLSESEERLQLLENSTNIKKLDQSLFLLQNERNPASSCSDIPQNRPSEKYWILSGTGSPVQVYCDMNRTTCSCNTTGGWMRVANLDMTDPNQTCSDGFRQVNRTDPPLRTCGRPGNGFTGCVSTTYQTHGVEYSHVCGQVIGYQDRTPDAFHSPAITIDSPYIDGVSLTHGQSPQQHIWSFVATPGEQAGRNYACPCTRPGFPLHNENIPTFVGQDYFCDTGDRGISTNIFYSNDPLWDGQGCTTSTCCHFNNPPWFCKQLPQPTTDDIELRICAGGNIADEDTPIERVELYIR